MESKSRGTDAAAKKGRPELLDALELNVSSYIEAHQKGGSEDASGREPERHCGSNALSECHAREFEEQLATAQLEISALHGTVLEDVKMREQWQQELKDYRAEIATMEAHLARLRHATEAFISRIGDRFAIATSRREDEAKAKMLVMENEIAQLRLELQAARRVGDSLLRGLRTALSPELPSHPRKRSDNFQRLRRLRWPKRTRGRKDGRPT